MVPRRPRGPGRNGGRSPCLTSPSVSCRPQHSYSQRAEPHLPHRGGSARKMAASPAYPHRVPAALPSRPRLGTPQPHPSPRGRSPSHRTPPPRSRRHGEGAEPWRAFSRPHVHWRRVRGCALGSGSSALAVRPQHTARAPPCSPSGCVRDIIIMATAAAAGAGELPPPPPCPRCCGGAAGPRSRCP